MPRDVLDTAQAPGVRSRERSAWPYHIRHPGRVLDIPRPQHRDACCGCFAHERGRQEPGKREVNSVVLLRYAAPVRDERPFLCRTISPLVHPRRCCTERMPVRGTSNLEHGRSLVDDGVQSLIQPHPVTQVPLDRYVDARNFAI